MQFTAQQIANLLQGQLEGNPDAVITKLAKIEEGEPGSISFLANPLYTPYLYTTKASLVIINKDFAVTAPVMATLLRVESAENAFSKLLEMYNQVKLNKKGISKLAFISESASVGKDIYAGEFSFIGENAKIGDNVKIYPQVFIGDNVKIGNNCVLHPGVKMYHGCTAGKNVTIHGGTVIGSDGFGFAPQSDGTYKKVPQIGNVVIEDNVEIGSNSTIDRATIGSTVIHSGAKLDNLIQIAHNVEVGHHTVVAAQSGVSGSTKIGNNVMIGGQAGIVGHLVIADGTKINAQSGVSKSIKTPNTAVTGSPAYDYTSALRSQALTRNLPELEKRVKDLEQIIQQLLAEKIIAEKINT